jgi:hypothetical protein
MVVCQRTEWLDDEEYKARMQARRDHLDREKRREERSAMIAENAAINAQITATQKMLDEARATGVESKKSGFLRGEKFVFGGVEYATRGEAEAALQARIAELETELVALPKTLKDVPPEL